MYIGFVSSFSDSFVLERNFLYCFLNSVQVVLKENSSHWKVCPKMYSAEFSLLFIGVKSYHPSLSLLSFFLIQRITLILLLML